MSSRTKAVLSYVGLFVTGILFLVIEKKDKFVRKSAAQSTVFGLGVHILSFCIKLTPFLCGFVNFIFLLFCFIVWVILICKAYDKIYYRLPIVGEISEKYVLKWFKV